MQPTDQPTDLRIDQMFAFVSVDPQDGNEGVLGFQTPDGWMPMVGADMSMVDKLKPMAERIARETGIEVKLINLSTRTEVETIS